MKTFLSKGLLKNSFRQNFGASNKFSFTKKFNQKSFSNFLGGKKDHEQNKSKDESKSWLSEKDQDFRVTTKTPHLQFSKAPILDNYGELQPGEIPEPLKYIRPFEMTVLDNGIRVCTERWDSPICAVGAFVDAGSRYEFPGTSGSAHFLEHLLFKGTKNRTKSQFESEIESMGATMDAYTSREHTLYHMQCFKNDLKKSVSILGDMLLNPLLNKAQVEDEKDTIQTELQESNKDMQETIMEAVHFNCYRDHYMGQPILGDIDNIQSVTQDMVKEYHAAHYVGKNLIIVGTGNVNHKEFVDMVANEFGRLQ
jgi:predicted Zn-dependent peptidase